MSLVSVSRLLTDQNLPTGGYYDILFMDFSAGYGTSPIRFSLIDLSNDTYYLNGEKVSVDGFDTVGTQTIRYVSLNGVTYPFRLDNTPYSAREIETYRLRGTAATVSLQPGPSNGFSRATAGIQKLVQYFLKVLFTTKGSDPMNPGRGTSVFSGITRGNIGDTSQLTAALRADINDAATQVVSLTTNFENDDERLQSVDILTILVQDDSVYVAMSLTAKSGTTVAFYAPFPLLDMTVNIL